MLATCWPCVTGHGGARGAPWVRHRLQREGRSATDDLAHTARTLRTLRTAPGGVGRGCAFTARRDEEEQAAPAGSSAHWRSANPSTAFEPSDQSESGTSPEVYTTWP